MAAAYITLAHQKIGSRTPHTNEPTVTDGA